MYILLCVEIKELIKNPFCSLKWIIITLLSIFVTILLITYISTFKLIQSFLQL
jgi:hypothetical protein